jgi:hypothetical protein
MSNTLYYYPALSELINADDLPEILSFIGGDIEKVFNNVYYKNIQISKKFGGDGAFYSLDILSQQKIQVGIFDSGLNFVLNPDFTDNSVSSFPITVFWEWEILKSVGIFDATGFSFSPDDLFTLALGIFNISEVQCLILAANTFVVPAGSSTSFFSQLVADINAFYSSSIIVEEGIGDPYQSLITQINNIGQTVVTTIFNLYITNDDLTTTLANLTTFFYTFVPSDFKTYVENLILPTARATLELSAALEFPRNYLLPMVQTSGGFVPDNSTDSSGNLKQAYIQFGDAILDFDTSTGFGYQTSFAGTLYPTYCQIGNTCLIVSFSNVKLDLSQTSSIPDIAAAGYPDSFVGAYIGSAALIINGFGTDSTTNESASISVSNFIVGTGGVSGKVTLADQGILYHNFGSFSAELDTFSLTFLQNVITNCTISGLITLNNYQINGQPAKIKIQAQIKDDKSFSVTALPQANLFTITLQNVFNMPLATDNLMDYIVSDSDGNSSPDYRNSLWSWQGRIANLNVDVEP